MSTESAMITFDHAQVLPPFGFRLPTRMTVLRVADGGLALVSPVPLDDARVAALAELGEVRWLIAPNLLHHLYLGEAARRYPSAQVLAPAALRAKRSDLRIDRTLEEGLPEPLAGEVELVHIEGAPAADEFALYHAGSRSLIVTDLVFNVVRPRGWFTRFVLYAVGCHGRLASSRTWRVLVRDRAAAARSCERLLAFPFETLVMAHGEVVRVDARARLGAALAWLGRPALALPSATVSRS